jgi:hypothetical protein
MAQIHAMNIIYEGASLVLATAYGTSADAGLPGIEPLRFPLRAMRREYIHAKARILSCSTDLRDAVFRTI